MNSSSGKFTKGLDQLFLKLHTSREDFFWNTYMGIKNQQKEFLLKEKELNEFKTNEAYLKKAREFQKRSSKSDLTLKAWTRFFERNVIESDSAKSLLHEITALESKIQNEKRTHLSEFKDPKTNRMKQASSNVLSMMVGTEKKSSLRKAAYEGLLKIEDFVLDHHFTTLIKLRNAFAKAQGFEDFMDYKCQFSEGMSKKETFELVETAVGGVRKAWRKNLKKISDHHGKNVLKPWNFRFATTGDLSHEMDPYFPFEKAIHTWTESFESLGVQFRGANLTLDLLDRKGKYENGFMHGPFPCFYKNKKWIPARINFTANANPKQVGSGFRALNTLFHEGGHAAHFSNITQASPIFSQEYPPTSMAMAETQSMFLDALVADPHWQIEYAKNRKGETIPLELITKSLQLQHPLAPNMLNSLSVVSLFEKQLYELPEKDLTPKKIKALAREVENEVFGMLSARPLLTIPHLLSIDSSCSYHGYLFAMFAVAQTRHYFFEKFGRITNNAKIGAMLTKHYWNPGNSKTFNKMVKDLTKRALSPEALIKNTTASLETQLKKVKTRIQETLNAPRPSVHRDLTCQIRIIHGRKQIATNKASNKQLAKDFSLWIQKGHF